MMFNPLCSHQLFHQLTYIWLSQRGDKIEGRRDVVQNFVFVITKGGGPKGNEEEIRVCKEEKAILGLGFDKDKWENLDETMESA